MRPRSLRTTERLRRDDSDGQFEGRRHKADYAIVIATLALAIIGLIVIYSLSPAIAALSGESDSYYTTRHVVAFIIGLVMMGVSYNIPMQRLSVASYILGTLGLLASALIVVIDGIAYRWIKIAGLSFQPVEMIKLALLLWLAFFVARLVRSKKIDDIKSLKPVGYIAAITAIVVVIIQRDLGSMVVLAAIIGVIVYVAGIPMKPLLVVGAVTLLLGAFAIASTEYRRERFATFLNPEKDCEVEGYHACQALIAVGSGGLVGLGVGNSVQAYGHLPETPTDSIFAIYAEKFGFIGSVTFVGLVGFLVYRLFIIASRTTSWEPRLITVGVATWIGIQSTINIGAMLGLLPLKGITLPLVSYGGSSLIFVMMALGVVLRISCYTSVRKHNLEGVNENFSIRRGDRRTYNTPRSGRS